MRVNRTYTKDFKTVAMRMLHRGDRAIVHVAKDLSANVLTLRYWLRQDMAKKKRSNPQLKPA